MPAKDRRVAARQARLRQRRKKQSRGPSGTPAATPPTTDGASQTTRGVATETPSRPLAKGGQGSMSTPAPTTPTTARPSPTGPWRGAARSRPEQPMSYAYVGRELRRIALLSGAIFIILIVLAIVLQ